MQKRRRILKYTRRVGALWKAFIRHNGNAKYIIPDAEGVRLLQKCIDVQYEFTRYHPHPENIRLLKRFLGLMTPTSHPPNGGESKHPEALLETKGAFLLVEPHISAV